MSPEFPGGISLAEVWQARHRIQGRADRTPLRYSPSLSRRFGARVWLKLENMQPTGAFKLRGASNMIAALLEQYGPDRLKPGVITASTGNHGRAVAWAARELGIPATVCLSSLVPANKVAAIEALGAEVCRCGNSQDDAFAVVDERVASRGQVAIPPFDHPLIVAGQGTLALELLEERPQLDMVVAGLSGGGLLGGIGLVMKQLSPRTEVVGVSLSQGAAMWHSLQAGKPVQVEEVPSLADSLGGGIGLDNRHTLALVRAVMDSHYQVPETAIARAMVTLLEQEKMLLEGAAAVGLAAIEHHRIPIEGKEVALVLSGNNVALETFERARELERQSHANL
ncbi:hydroxyectoine utilization dehydratase EutB [Enterobacteriaceae bacterium BIT-l23]|uniref:Hydroxyectoine utilization dehydratase EutB n=1 Tax=Jejubacter calystegiae TaxID=2579935 RepID=A0A4P8YKJ4_9ENTR|nr:hydroxyectoine utilization dehydratase EutB [Jejubacter calystegiae]NUU67963.1 hydroxyectoine utilization dehydratase EutB [Enterobacteriaceae bacterium BIT-l23]QCT21280.1 hydroxyectoine utilization dehydratase EutB [Jejubacter calystegiae]